MLVPRADPTETIKKIQMIDLLYISKNMYIIHFFIVAFTVSEHKYLAIFSGHMTKTSKL